ncbi:MAG TPA: aminotransferase class V-fold PLP-dependent enzyme [Terriglobales bacterium]|nr:aminotransferase class V-fold PLP-dependent enzyme [Terriglobales bacterium]
MISSEIIRREFPAVFEKTYLNAGALSIAPQRAIAAMRRMTEIAGGQVEAGSGQIWGEFDTMLRTARQNAAWLINAEESEIALVESTTRGMSIAADTIPLSQGDRVLFCDMEYPAVALPWIQKQQTTGIEIDVVPNRRGEVHVEDFAGRITPRTKVVAVSSVQWTSGFRCDLAAFSRLCRDRGIFLVVDAVQQLGAIPLDVKATPADFIACGGHKWLNTPFGMGFLYVSREIMPRLKPCTAGLMGTVPPEGGWGPYLESPNARAVRQYSFIDEARRFEVGGTTNFGGAGALGASLSLLRELGKENIADHIRRLTDQLTTRFQDAGLDVITGTNPERRAGIVTFDLGSPERNRELAAALERERIIASVRYSAGVGGVRISCHFYNSSADVDHLLESTESFVRTVAHSG